jgi:hypothetical protein
MFDELSIQPGASAVLTSTVGYYLAVQNATLGTTMPVDFCFYLTVPNGEIDAQFSNNQMCSTFDFLITGLTGRQADQQLRVFPVPAREIVEVESSAPVDRYEVYSTDGKLLLNGAPRNQRVSISLADYSPGIYFLKLDAGSESSIRKIVKE